MTQTHKQKLARQRNWAILRLRGSISSLDIDPDILGSNKGEIEYNLYQAKLLLLRTIKALKEENPYADLP